MIGYDVYEVVHEETRNAAISRKNETAGSCSSVVEHSLGKGEVVRSIRIKSTKNENAKKWKPTFWRPSQSNPVAKPHVFDWQDPICSIHC